MQCNILIGSYIFFESHNGFFSWNPTRRVSITRNDKQKRRYKNFYLTKRPKKRENPSYRTPVFFFLQKRHPARARGRMHDLEGDRAVPRRLRGRSRGTSLRQRRQRLSVLYFYLFTMFIYCSLMYHAIFIRRRI